MPRILHSAEGQDIYGELREEPDQLRARFASALSILEVALLAASMAWPSHHSDLLESPVSCRNEISLYKYASDSAE